MVGHHQALGGARRRSMTFAGQEGTGKGSVVDGCLEQEESHKLFYAGVALLNADIHHLFASAVWAGPHPRQHCRETPRAEDAGVTNVQNVATSGVQVAAADMLDFDEVSARSPIANCVQLVEILCGVSAVPKAWMLAVGEGGRPMSPGSASLSPDCEDEGAGSGGDLLRLVRGAGDYGDGPDSDLGDLQWDADVTAGGFEIVDFPLPPTPSAAQNEVEEWEFSNRN
jgi:hypothetical protein